MADAELEARDKLSLLAENVDLDRINEETSTSMLFWLFDPARLIIFVVSLFLIYNGSKQAVKLDRELKDSPVAEGVQDLTCYHVVCMPIAGSLMLLVMFYFFEYIQFFYMLLSIIVSTTAFTNFIYPLIKFSLNWFYKRNIFSLSNAHLPMWIAAGLSVVMSTAWVLTGHWFCLDALGMSLCVLMIQFVRVPSLKVATILLLGLLLYDIFWVFYSSSIFNANVMVEVAVKKANNPVAVVAEKLNLPDMVKSRPPLSIPGKLLVPSLFNDKSYAMLGLGDIVLPGLLLCFAMRFDSGGVAVSGRGSAPSGSGRGLTKVLMCCQKWSYFCSCLTGYALGLCMASVIADVYRAAQPALLYLVPGVLIPLFVKAIIQGDFWSMWNGPFSQSLTASPLPSTNSEKRGYHHVGKYTALLPS